MKDRNGKELQRGDVCTLHSRRNDCMIESSSHTDGDIVEVIEIANKFKYVKGVFEHNGIITETTYHSEQLEWVGDVL